VQAVRDVSFDLARGERLAVVGESGSGKSVMSMALMQMIARGGSIDGGEVWLDGREVLQLSTEELRHVRGGEVAMVFQDPTTSLNPVMTVREQITKPMQQHLGLSPDAARARAIHLLGATGIPDPERHLDSYPHELSGGMRQRVMIAMAISCDPSLLIADEPTTALDVTIQAQIVALLRKISEEHNSSVIFVTHDMGLVARFADRVAVMYAGRIIELATAAEIFDDPKHPYTQGLLASIPSIDSELPERLSQIAGAPPNLSALGVGCAFAPRCPHRSAECDEIDPPLVAVGEARAVACLLHVDDLSVIHRPADVEAPLGG
jgi:oligopeptide/dipeptide ABC transporter ATP-binding protein